MHSAQIITLYEEMLAITGKMLVTAQKGDWETLIILEKECQKLTKKLIQNSSEPELSNALQRKKAKIIRQVLNDNAEIKSITEPRMKELQEILDTTGHKRHLQRAYHSDQMCHPNSP